jgi:hypothetical protein
MATRFADTSFTGRLGDPDVRRRPPRTTATALAGY